MIVDKLFKESKIKAQKQENNLNETNNNNILDVVVI